MPKYVLHNTSCLRHWSILDSGTNYWYVLQCYYIFPLMVDYLCFQIDWINFEVASHKLLILLHWMTKSVSEWSYLEIIWCIYLRNELIDLMVFMLVIDSYGLIWKIWKVLHKGPSLYLCALHSTRTGVFLDRESICKVQQISLCGICTNKNRFNSSWIVAHCEQIVHS